MCGKVEKWAVLRLCAKTTFHQLHRGQGTLSRQQTVAEVFQAFREADEGWKVSEGDNPISEEVMETASERVAGEVRTLLQQNSRRWHGEAKTISAILLD